MENLTIVWNEKFLEFFDYIWNSLVFWRYLGLFLIICFILLIIFKSAIKRVLLLEQIVKHDREMFRVFDLLMSEKKLNDLLDCLQKKHFYDKKAKEYVSKFIESLNAESKQYVDNKIKKSSLSLCEALTLLDGFIIKNFVIFPGDEKNSEGMYPNPEIDGGGNDKEKNAAKFKDFDEQLNALISDVKNKYQRYRIQIKQNLQI